MKRAGKKLVCIVKLQSDKRDRPIYGLESVMLPAGMCSVSNSKYGCRIEFKKVFRLKQNF